MKVLGPSSMPEEAVARIGWFIRLRWLAAAGVLVLATAGRLLLRLQISITPFALIAIGIALYNAIFLFFTRKRWEGKASDRFATVQVVADTLALTVVVHFGGGIENPFISFYLFHIVIAAILLPWLKVDLHVLFASLCIAVLATSEYTGLLPHRHVEGFLPMELYTNWKFVIATVSGLITTLCVTAFLAASIAERLHERETQLAEANKVLAEQDLIKSQYVMRVAHDLAEPAGMITSCLKIVTQGLAGSIPEKAMDMVQRAESKSLYLGHLVRDLLSLARIKAAKRIPKSAVNLPEVISQVFADVQPHVHEKTLTLEWQLPDMLPAVYGNAKAIHELIGNLVTNAVKYTPVGGRVNVSASNTGPNVLIKVQDNGVGIPIEAIPHIFEEFYRADNVKAEAVEGTGLGLSIVSRILHAHNGDIWVESQEGKGTTFSFTLPLVEESHVD